uniref:Uncharacterized protein n=1 Tax=Nelumbo nucifera TaxID=4432 RepID=A0A822Y480_NELNU|nr:TPA_asm: hypothetical protein HUJ06_025902 [Nelumbo nucifera]
MEGRSLGLIKGSWTREEDALLRKCIEKYGEGKWHLVPYRAGRLPGRTANDIKNYWYSKLSKENISGGAEVRAHTTVFEKKKIYRPKPWRFKDSRWLTGLSSSTTVDNTYGSGDMQSQASPPRPPP